MFYTYASGVPTIANAAYSTGYFVQGVSTTSATPLQATNDSKYYVYVANVSATLASGGYSNGYFSSGEISTGATYDTPAQSIDDNLSYTYTAGVAALASGYYSNGKYVTGALASGSGDGVQSAIDDGLYYTYNIYGAATLANGLIDTLNYYNGNLMIGAYSSGYFTGGSVNSGYNSSTPAQAQDDSKWYTYASGVATAASGLYSNGNYVAGELSGTSATPAQAQDDSKWYTYASGVVSYATGISAYDNNALTYYRYDGAGGRVNVQAGADTNNIYYYFTSFTIGGYMYNSSGAAVINGWAVISGYEYGTDGAGQINTINDVDPYN